ncbi:uncharacterized protein LOC101900824 [Musca domestica]|uniref:Uncharacterized protein LOC101900824 n=1 Tax=Musca domestica TaxID=7370 RepID=A0A1I8NAR8_MUSDO|nr:uncharacterized protein LOC101900824 [Musca domestica]
MKLNEPSSLGIEEGEIVDEYELISSDEEVGMRERIRELEEKNAEIEFISQISRSYDIERAARIPTDVSSISSTEFKTPKKRKRHKNKEHKVKCHHHRHHSSSTHHRHHSTQIDKKSSRSRKTRCKRKEKLLRKKHAKYAYRDYGDNLKLGLVSPDSLGTDLSSSLSDSEDSQRLDSGAEDFRDDYHYRENIRDTLRLAVSRHRKNSTRQTKHKNGLMEKLMRRDEMFSENVNSFQPDDQNIDIVEDADADEADTVEMCPPPPPNENLHNVPEDSCDSLEERELRLIALKSAILKKHMERKKRNAEAAYSPTDFDEIIMPEEKLDDIEVIDLEEDDDSQNACATVSPITSPQLMLLDGPDESSQIDCKPVDMDIANSDSDEANDNCWGVVPMTQPMSFSAFAQQDMANLCAYGNGEFYIGEFPVNTSNPPPPGVDDYEDIKQPDISFDKYQDSDGQDMELDNEFEPIESYPSQNQNMEPISVPEVKTEFREEEEEDRTKEDDLQEEEEEMALRALLLAKFQSPKNQQKKPNVVERDTSSNMDVKPKIAKPTEAILKEAVKRLQIHSQLECRQESGSHEAHIKTERDISRPLSCDPLHRKNDVLISSQDNSRDSESLALVTLQRKAKQLKCHNEIKEISSHRAVDERRQDDVMSKDRDFESRYGIGVYGKEETLMTRNEYVDERGCDFGHNEHQFNGVPNQHKYRSKFDEFAEELDHVQEPPAQPDSAEITESAVTYASNDQTENIPVMDKDIKRRLQKLKDEILSATKLQLLDANKEAGNAEMSISIKGNQVSKHLIDEVREEHPTMEKEETEKAVVVQKDTIDKPPTSMEIEKPGGEERVTKPLPVLANDNTNHPRKKEISKNNTALKENNVNSVNKKPVENISSKPEQPSAVKKATKTITKTINSISAKQTKLNPSKAVVINSNTVTPNVLPQITVTATVKPPTLPPTYSVLRTTKIVKPNKVINRNIDTTKRKVILIKSEQNSVQTSQATPAKQIKLEPSIIPANKPADNSRLITSMEQVKHMCNVAQLVISVQNSSNESSDEEWPNCDSFYKPLIDYNDNASPLSLNMESPCLTPIRSRSPIDMAQQNTEEAKTTGKRSPVVLKKPAARTMSPKTPITGVDSKTKTDGNLKTPVAVRHLPPAAQDEYRQLVHRMKLLENQRNKKDNKKASENDTNPNVCSDDTTKMEEEQNLQIDKKSSLVKKVLLRNANKPQPGTVVTSNENPPSKATTTPHHSKTHKTEVLRSYENLYAKIGSGIVNNLDKSLKLVEEARKAKVNKLQLEERLRELRAEMDLLQTKHKEEEQKISRIYPTICSTNEVITSLKQKRSKVFKAAIGLGKTLKGEEYRLNNDLKQNIINKTKLLAAEIKIVNSLKAENIKTLLNEKTGLMEKTDALIEAEEEEENKDEKKTPPSDEDTSKKPSTPAINKTEINVDTRIDASKILGGSTEFQDTANAAVAVDDAVAGGPPNNNCDTNSISEYETFCSDKPASANQDEEPANKKDEDEEEDTGKSLPSYISPLDHIRCSNEGTLDPNGVVCPYDLMGNCEDVNCKYVHISSKDNKQPEKQIVTTS